MRYLAFNLKPIGLYADRKEKGVTICDPYEELIL